MKLMKLVNGWKLAAALLLSLGVASAANVAQAQTGKAGANQTVKVRGAYNGRGYQPGYEYNPKTGWARTSNGFNWRPESGYTSPTAPMQKAPTNRGQYPQPQPRTRFNYGQPYLEQQPDFGNIRNQPQGGWLNGNWGW